jgi:hypothetical protein
MGIVYDVEGGNWEAEKLRGNHSGVIDVASQKQGRGTSRRSLTKKGNEDKKEK